MPVALKVWHPIFVRCDRLGIGSLEAVEPVHVASYIEELGKSHSAPSVKQSLAAIRHQWCGDQSTW